MPTSGAEPSAEPWLRLPLRAPTIGLFEGMTAPPFSVLPRQIWLSFSAFMRSRANAAGEDMKPRCPPGNSTISRPNR